MISILCIWSNDSLPRLDLWLGWFGMGEGVPLICATATTDTPSLPLTFNKSLRSPWVFWVLWPTSYSCNRNRAQPLCFISSTNESKTFTLPLTLITIYLWLDRQMILLKVIICMCAIRFMVVASFATLYQRKAWYNEDSSILRALST